MHPGDELESAGLKEVVAKGARKETELRELVHFQHLKDLGCSWVWKVFQRLMYSRFRS